MMDGLKVYAALALADVRQQMQHRASFVMNLMGNLLATLGDAVGILALFASFGSLDGWTLPEVAVLYGMMSTAFALAEGIGRGFDRFAEVIRRGDFDRVLLRPRGTVFQVLASRLELSRAGRLIQGLGVLALGLCGLEQPLAASGYALVVICILGGVLLFLGLLMMQGAACFWTVESLEVFNVLTYGGITMAAYPLDIYQKWLRNFFLYVIPLGFLNYLPCALLFGKAMPYPAFTAYLALAAGGAVLALGALAWKMGVLHYRSCGA